MDSEATLDQSLSKLEANPVELGPMERLELQGFDDWVTVVEALVERAEAAEASEVTARMYLEAGRVALSKLGAEEPAGEYFQQTIQAGQGTTLVAEGGLFQTGLEGGQQEMLEFFKKAYEQAGSQSVGARLYYRMGNVLEVLFEEWGQAAESYEYAIQLDDGSLPARWAWERVARRRQDWETLHELLTQELERVDEQWRRIQVTMELGRLYAEEFDDTEHAVECYTLAYELDPDNRDAKEALVDLGELDPAELDESKEAGDEPEVAADDGDEVEEVAEDSVVEEEEIEELDEDSVVEEDEIEELGEDSVVEVVDDDEESGGPPDAPPSESEGASEEVEAAPADQEAGEGEVEGSTEEAEELEEADDGDTVEDVEDAEVEEAEELEEADDEETAEDVEDAEVEEADDEETAEDLEDAEVEEADDLEEADDEETTEDVEDAEVDEAERDEVGEDEEGDEAADAGDDKTVESEEAEPADEDAPAEDAKEESADETDDDSEATGDWRDRAAAYRERARDASSDEAVRHLAETARLQWLNEGRLGGDPSLWQDATELDVAEDFYNRVHFFFDGEDYWNEVVDHLEESGANPALSGRVALYHLGDRERAEAAAEADDYDELDSAVWVGADALPDDRPEGATLLHDAVEDAESAEDNWRRFQRSLDKRHSDLPEDAQAKATYGYLSDLARATGQEKKEIDALRRLDRQVDDPRVQQRLMVCYRRAEKWPMYVDGVKDQAESIDEEDRLEDRIEWLREAIRVYRDEMDHDMKVVNTYKEILEIDPENVDAVDNLIEMYGDMGRSSELINALQQKAELVDDDQEKVELYTEIAELFLDKFRNQAEAIDAYESVLEIDPHHEEALEFLTEMYEKRRNWDDLVDVRRRAVEGIEDEAARAEELKDVAELASDKLRKPERAMELWLDVRELRPEDRDALDALEELYEKNRDHDKLAETVEDKVELVEDESAAMELYQKLGMLYSDRLEDPDSAIEAWRRALEIDPDDRKARKALERLYVDNRKFDELEEFYAERDEHRELVRMFDTLVGTVDEDEVKIEILLRAARIWRTELEEMDRAKRNLERALEIDDHHEGIARELEPIYRDEQNWKGLREVLEIILDHQETAEDRLEYQLELAELHEEQLDEPSAAFDWYTRAVAEAPEEASIAEAAERVAGASERWADLVEVYEQVLEEAEDPDVVERLRLQVGRVLFEELGQSEPALNQFQAVLDEDEENLEALAQMEKIHREAERWDELMGVYQRRLDLTDAVEDKIEILRGIAEIAELQKGDLGEAVERLNEALELGPKDEATLEELRRLYREQGAHGDRVEVIERQIEIIEERAAERAESSPEEAVGAVDIDDLVVGAELEAPRSEAEVVDEETEDAEPSDVEPADESDAVDVESEAEAESAEEAESDHEQDADDREDVETADEDESADGETEFDRDHLYHEEEVDRLVELRYELGTVLDEHLDRGEEAADALARVVAWRPDHEDARFALEAFLDDEDLGVDVAGALEPVYAVHGEWENLVDVLDIQAAAAEEDDRELARLERRGDVLLEEIGAPERSFEAYGECLRLAPDDDRIRSQLVRIAEGADLWERYGELLDSVAEELEGDLRRSYLSELGEVHAERLDQPTRSEAYYREILDEWPEERDALEALEVVYARTERWQDLLGVLEDELEFADAEETRELKYRIAVLHDQMLEQPYEAIDVLRSILEDHPEQLRAIRALNRLYEQNELWDDLAEMFERELELVDDDEVYEVKKRLADTVHRRLEDHSRAVDLYEEVLDDRPEDREAITSMEELMHLQPAPSGRISRILEPLYLESESWPELIEALEVQVEESDDEEEQVELLHRIADLREERQEDQRGAFETLSRALAVDPEHEGTLDELYRLADAVDDWEALVDVFEVRADSEADPDRRRDLLRRAAAVYLDRLEMPREAAPLLHEVLEIFPDDLETVEQLEDIYRQIEDWEELVDILRHKADHVEDDDEAKELLYQAGNIYDEILVQPEDAVEVYREVLALDAYDEQAIDRLEQLFTQLEWWTELLEIYETKLELAEEPEARKDLLYAMAPIYEERLEQPYEAIDTYQEILDEDPDALEALEALADLYDETEQWHELLEVLEDQRDLVSLPDEELNLQFEIGQLWETELGDVLQAVEVYEEILEQDPDHAPTRDALADLIERGDAEVEAAEVLYPIYEEAGEWEKLVHVQQLLIEASHDPDRKLELYREVGDIYEEQLADPTSAFETYLEALDVEPNREALLDTIERLAAELDGWDVVIDRFDQVLEEQGGFEIELELNRRIGRILDEEIGNPAAAIDRYEDALDVEPEHPEVTRALDVLYQEQERWEDLAEILQTRIYTVEDEEQTLDLQSRLGLLYRDALEEPGKAVDTIQSILEEHPENDFAVESLEEMFKMGDEADRIMGILEPWYVERDRHESLVELYLQRLERLEDPLDRFDLLKQVGQLYLEELDSPENALQVYGMALAEQPDADEVLRRLEELAEETVLWDQAAEFVNEALGSPQLTDEAAVDLWLELARIREEELGHIQEAENAYLEVLELQPDHEKALEALDDIYEEQGRWADLANILQQRLEHTYDEDVSVDVQYRLAQIYQYELDDLQSAVDTYRDLLDIRPMHEATLDDLEEIFRAREQWEELYDILDRKADATEVPGEKIECYAQMAMIAEEMLDRPFDAIDLWNDVRQHDPNHQEALQELARLYYAEEQWDELVEVIEQQLELTDDPETRLELYKSLGTVWGEKLGNDGPALDAWREVLDLDETDLEALRALRDIYTRQGNYEELAPILEQLIAHEEVAEAEQQEIWVELAEIRSEMLLDPEGAIEAWREVLSIDPEHQRALDNLEELYIQEAQWEEAAQVLELQAERVEDDAARIDLLTRIAEMWEQKLEQPDRAAAFYEEILEIDATDMQASRSLEEIYREQSDPEALQGLVGLYLDRAEVLEGRPFERMEALQSAARVYEEGLDNPVNALVVLVSAFTSETYDDERLTEQIERLAKQTDQWNEVVEKYQEVIRELGDSPEAARLHEQVGRWYADELDQPDDAIYHLRRALDIDPDRVEILEVLENLYRELESWPELAQVLQERIERTTDPDREMDLWRSLGELYELQMGAIEDAIEAYWSILEIDDADLLAIESLERLYEQDEQWEELIAILERKAESTYDPDDLIEIRTRIASIWEEQLGAPNEAIDAYEELLADEPDHEPALESLERLYFQTEQWEELLDIYDERLSLTHEPEEQLDIHAQRASLWEDQLGDVGRAVEAFEEMLVIDPNHEGAMRNLERLYRELEEWFDLVEILQNHIELVEEPERKVELLNELGRVQRNQIEEPYAAIEAFRESRELDPNQAQVLLNLAELHEQTENWESAAEVYQDLLHVVETEEEQVEIHFTVGELLEHELADVDEAEHHYQKALELHPEHDPTWEALEGLYERTEQWEGLIDLYTSAADRTMDLSETARYLARAGGVYDHELEERRRALDFYEQALEEDPRELEAAEPLIELYLDEDEWERAVPLLEMVIEEYQQDPDIGRDELEDRYVELARVYEDLSQNEHAIEQYWNAYDLDHEDVDVLLGLGRLLHEEGEYRDAQEMLERIEREHEAALETDELIELYYRSGKSKQHFGALDDAMDYYEQAVELDGYHQPSLEALDDVHEEAGNWEDVVEYKRRLLEVAEEDKFRFALLTDIGEICVDELGDPTQAIEAYQDAMSIKPGSVAVLRKLLEIYRSADQWHEAVDILDRLIEQQDDPDRKAKFSYTAAVIYRDKIGNPEAAIEYFDQALDNDIEHLEAFEAIDRIFTEMREWKELERAYRRMLRRISEQEELAMEDIKFKLWEGLGEIYRSRLEHPKSAIQAFETAAGLQPENERIRLILAELYEETGQNLEGVIEQHQALIEDDPFRIESYKALFRVYLQTNQYDRAWCMASALTFLEKASDEERRIYEQYRKSNLRKAKANLDQEALDRLYHPEQETLVNNIMGILNQGLREVYADDKRNDWGLDPAGDQLDLNQGMLFANIYKYVAETVNIAPVPEVYLKEDQALGLRNANVTPPAVVAGADVVRNTDDKELAFRIGKLLGGMRSEYYLGSIGWPTEVLKMFFMAAMHVTNPNMGLEQQLNQQGMMVAQEIQNMPSQLQMQLRKHVSQYLKKGENPNLSRWLRYLDHTTNRIGLLICGDLETAARFVKSDRTAISKASVKDQVREMILFLISDEFTKLRERLGLAIG